MFCPSKRVSLSFIILLLLSWSVLGKSKSPLIEKFAEQLIEAKNETHRLALLKASPERLNHELLSQLLLRGDNLRLGFEYSKSMSAYKLAQYVAEDITDSAGKSAALRGIGQLHMLKSEFNKATNLFEEALEISEKANDFAGKAECLRLIAAVHGNQQWQSNDINLLEESFRIDKLIHNKSGMAKSLHWMALYHRELSGNPQLYFDELQKSLELSEEAGDVPTQASALNSLAIYYDNHGNFDLALEYYKRAKELNRISGDLLKLSHNIHNIATIYHSRGNFIAALQGHLESMKIREKIGTKRIVAFSLSEIGNLYADQGQYDIALKYLNRSYPIYVESGDTLKAAQTLCELGTIHNLAGESEKAIQYFQQSLQQIRQHGEIYSSTPLYLMAEFYASRRQFDKARQFFREALNVLEKWPRAEIKTKVLERMAWAELESQNFSDSLRFAAESIETSRKYEFEEQLWSSLLTQAKCYMALAQYPKARSSLEESIRTLESLRHHTFGSEEQRGMYLERRTEPYKAMVELLIAEEKPAEALVYSERAKARILVDALQKGRLDIERGATVDENQKEAKLKENLYVLNAKLQSSITSDDSKISELKMLKDQIDKARFQLETFQAELYAIHPELKIERGEAEIIDPAKVQSQLQDEKTAYLEFIVLHNKTFLFLLMRSHLQNYEIHVSEDELKKTISAFRNQIAIRNPGFRHTAKALYSLLLGGVESRISNLDQIVIIPDGILWELPFQALITSDDKYLLLNSVISYAPSITALNEMMKVKRKKTAEARLLAFANPFLGKETTNQVQMVFRDAKLHPLPEAELEVYGYEHSSIYIGPSAKESVLKQEIGKYQIIHLATHGILNEANPMYSHLLFSRSGSGDSEDGLLEAWEIMKLDLHANLAILSACETARGRISFGEGMIGLNWAFFVAGCPTTIVSQWKVESSSAGDLMFRFHENLVKKTLPAAQALRQAALSIQKNPTYSHPFYWAAFVLVGAHL
jgi:CHAT domain-containing protein/tetratricopeptide (TPR) repeat protein